MTAKLLFHEKRFVPHVKEDRVAVAEIKVWQIPASKDYPKGLKYSLFLVAESKVVIGFDNHKPKGPHIHFGDNEHPYTFEGVDKLVDDFWDMARKAGYEL